MMRSRLPAVARGGGQSATEFLVIFPVLVMLVFGIIQFGLVYQARATMNHAVLLAARAGAMNNGSKLAMRNALAAGLVPLTASAPTMTDYNQKLLRMKTETNNTSLTELTVLNPTRAAFTDFGQAPVAGNTGRELPNDTLAYRTTTPGASSRISIQDANLLHVRFSYCYRLIVPLIDRVIYAAVNATGPSSAALSANGMRDPFGSHGTTPRTCLDPLDPQQRFKRIRITSEAVVRMQSPYRESNL